jgi:hypothetical protein
MNNIWENAAKKLHACDLCDAAVKLPSMAPVLTTVSYFEIVFAVLEHFWWRKCCQKRGGKWNCNRRRETIIRSQVQEIMPKGA